MAVQRAEASRMRIKSVGSGHSPSDIAITDGFLIDMSRLTHLLPLPVEQLRAGVNPKHLVNVQGGITIKDLNHQLDQKELALLNMGAIDAQTITGAISTGTHGTGRNQISMPGMVRSIVVVASGSRVFRVEPTRGLTDPEKHDELGIELIQKDQLFYSLILNLGAMGVIYSLIIEVRPQYHLAEERIVTKWSGVKSDILSNKIFQSKTVQLQGQRKEIIPRGVTVMINPHKTSDDHLCMVSKTYEIEKFDGKIKTRRRSKLTQFLSDLPFTYWLYLWVVRHQSKLIPKLLDFAIKSTSGSKTVDRSHRVLHAGSAYIQNRSSSCEFAYPLDEFKYIKTVEDLCIKIKDLADRYNVYSSIPIGLRFTKASKAYLSPEYGHDVCYVVTPALLNQKGFKLLLNTYQEIHIKNGGRPHWAKITNRIDGRNGLIKGWYPKLETWLASMRFFNETGTFSSSFSDRLGLTL